MSRFLDPVVGPREHYRCTVLIGVFVHRICSTVRTAFLVVLLLHLLPPAYSLAQAPSREEGAELTVYLTTMGPGDLVYEKFGHNAIWIRDSLTGTTISYNYGIFDFRQERFITRFVQGRMLYQMGVDDAQRQLAEYAALNRSVTLQRLDMTPGQKHALREFLEWNWLPQNREYLYDYFRDNCSTRVRDALDHALGGVLRQRLRDTPTGTTYSSHSLRLTAASPATYTGLMIAFGLPTARPLDAWEESFVPMELMRHLRSIQVAGGDGSPRPLVAEEIPAFVADREPPPTAVPDRLWVYLLIGLAGAAALLLLARRARRRGFARAALALGIFFWGITTGFFGLILTLLWLFTDHSAAYPNLNLLHLNPLGLLLAAAAPFAVIGSRTSRVARLAWPVTLVLAIMSASGVLLEAFPALRQLNGPLIALVLPVHVAVAGALYLLRDTVPSPAEDDVSRTIAPAAV